MAKENFKELLEEETDKILFNEDKNAKTGILGSLIMKKIDRKLSNVKNKCKIIFLFSN
jgi:hypothetical protein